MNLRTIIYGFFALSVSTCRKRKKNIGGFVLSRLPNPKYSDYLIIQGFIDLNS